MTQLNQKPCKSVAGVAQLQPNLPILKMLTKGGVRSCPEHNREYEFYCLNDHVG